MDAALTECDEGGCRVRVVVVERGENLKTLIHGDGAEPHTQIVVPGKFIPHPASDVVLMELA